MKQYVYRPEQAGLSAWPPGELRLDGIEITGDPELADVFVCPGGLHGFTRPEDLDRFPYMRGNESRHVFFHCADHEVLYSKPCIFLRCNARPSYLEKDPCTVCWPWPVEDFREYVSLPDGGFAYDVSFHGWLSTEVRRLSSEACRVDPRLRADIAQYRDFCGYIYETPEGIRRRAAFRLSMRASRIALCPESIPGVFPYRFFEAMSAGRVPLLVGSGYILPFADRIPYQDFIIECPAERAERAADYVWSFVDSLRDGQIVEMGLKARYYWETWLQRDRWPELMGIAVRERISSLIGTVSE